MSANLGTNESYPAATTGGGVPTWLACQGAGISNANPQTAAPNGVTYGGNNTYQLTLSLSAQGGHTKVCTVTVIGRDNLTATPALTASLLQVDSYNSNPTTMAGTQESYPAPVSTVGAVVAISSVGGAGGTTSASFVVTANSEGQSQVDFSYPAFGNAAGTIGSGPADGTYNDTQASRRSVSAGSNLLQWPLNEVYGTLLVNVVA